MDVADLKPTLLLALAIFLASAPNPDSKAIAEMTANFIVPKNERALMASETMENRERHVSERVREQSELAAVQPEAHPDTR